MSKSWPLACDIEETLAEVRKLRKVAEAARRCIDEANKLAYDFANNNEASFQMTAQDDLQNALKELDE